MRGLLLLALVLSGCSDGADPLPAHQPGRVLGARDVGPVDPDERIAVVVLLRGRDPGGLERLLRLQAHGEAGPLRPDQFAARFGPSEADHARVLAWAAAHNLTVARTMTSRLAVTVEGRAADLARAFGTELRRFADERGTFRAPSRLFRGAAGVADLVEAVSGLDDSARVRSRRKDPPEAADPKIGPGGSREPGDLQALYQVNLVAEKGAGQTVAILGTGLPPFPNSDIGSFIARYNLPTDRFAQYTQVLLGGPNRDTDELAEIEYGENVLDAEMVFAFAPLASVIHVHTASNALGLFSDGIAFIVDQVPHAHAVSVSYGLCERFSTYDRLTEGALFRQGKAQGQTWFIASGDNGTDGCRDGSRTGVLSVDWPAAAPDNIGVGGTELLPGREVAWGGSGGGISEQTLRPAYQDDVAPQGTVGRLVPDVAALSGSPGVVIVAQGRAFVTGGTSAAAPMWAGIWALLHERKGSPGLTDAHERLYQLGAAASTAFHDITEGANSDGTTPGYPAVAGYDLATGWGTPNVAQLLAQY